MNESNLFLRRLLSQRGSYPIIAAAAASGQLHFPVTLFEGDLRDYVEENRPHLASILLFELAHEGQSIPEMERAAEVGGLQAALKCWAERLNRRVVRRPQNPA